MSSGVQNPGQPDGVESSAARGWRGRRSSRRVEARHAWQNQGDSDPERRLAARRFWSRLRIIGLLLGFGGLLAWLLAALLFSPTKTPLIFVGPVDYQWPLPPNAYVQEDLRGLQDLDDILEVRDSPDAHCRPMGTARFACGASWRSWTLNALARCRWFSIFASMARPPGAAKPVS